VISGEIDVKTKNKILLKITKRFKQITRQSRDFTAYSGKIFNKGYIISTKGSKFHSYKDWEKSNSGENNILVLDGQIRKKSDINNKVAMFYNIESETSNERTRNGI
jgi:hypothetical protein